MAAAGNTQPAPIPDPYYGHEDTAKLVADYIMVTFACPDRPPPPAQAAHSGAGPPPPPPPLAPPLATFVAYALHRTRLHQCVTFTALFLLQRLKNRFPAARGSSGHRLFISAFMIASKVICDDTYSNKSWCVVSQGMFSLKEVNQMEREMCLYLDWKINPPPNELAEFEAKLRQDAVARGCGSLSPSPSAAAIPAPPALHVAHHTHAASVSRDASYPSPPESPTKPAASSTASSSSSVDTDDTESLASSRASVFSVQSSTSTAATSLASSSASVHSKSGEPGFAFASRSVW